MSDWRKLSSASSRRDSHTCSYPGESGCRACRWFETRILGNGDEYRVEMIGKSIVSGEVDRVRVETTSSPNAVVDLLAMGEPHRRYIPKVSRIALHEAADYDSALGDALDDFDAVTR